MSGTLSTTRWDAGSAGTLRASRWDDYWQMSKPRITMMVLVTVVVGALMASWGQPDWSRLFHTVVATALVAISSGIWNQWIERFSDARMARTAGRPLAAGRMGRTEAFLFGSVTLVVGMAYLIIAAGGVAGAVCLATWASYVLMYTPMKRTSTWNTLVGAVPGALPVLIGWAAMGQPFDIRAMALFLIVLLWQFPHFMSIAWKYRRDYAAAGLKMITVIDPSGRRAGIQAVAAALALLPVSMVPAMASPPSLVYVGFAFVLGVFQLVCAWRFAIRPCDETASLLMKASFTYLPLVMLGLASIPLIS